MNKAIHATLFTAYVLLLFSCSKQAAKGDSTFFSESSKLRISKVESILARDNRKLAYSLLTPQEKYYIWMKHLENAGNDPSFTHEQKNVINEAKTFLSVSYFEGSKMLSDKSFDILKYRVSKLFTENFKTRIFNDLTNKDEVINIQKSVSPNMVGPVVCECHKESDFCGRYDFNSGPCAYIYRCEKLSTCPSNPGNNSGCGWFWNESCDGKCKEYTYNC